MKVTNLKYHLEDSLINKLNLLCLRCTKYNHQNVVLTDGKEGFGKSTITTGAAYYMSYTIRRPMKLFFDPEKLFDYAINHEDEILIWDDAAIAALSLEHYTKIIVKLIKLLLLARKKRHTYFFNIQEFFRMKEPIVARAVGLLHVYSRNNLDVGRFTYYDERSLQVIYAQWMKSKKKLYSRYYSARGTFPDIMSKIFNMEEYERLKDEMIQSIDKQEMTKRDSKAVEDLRRLRQMIANFPEFTYAELGRRLKTTEASIRRWKDGINLLSNETDGSVNGSDGDRIINSLGYIEPMDNDYLGATTKPVYSVPIIVRKPVERSSGLFISP